MSAHFEVRSEPSTSEADPSEAEVSEAAESKVEASEPEEWEPAESEDSDSYAVVIRSVSKRYRNQPEKEAALKQTNLKIRAGVLTALMGPSGSGKTTLLEILGLIRAPDDGEIRILGEVFDASSPEAARTRFRRDKMGFVFQNFALIGFLSAAENVELPLTVAGAEAADVPGEAEAILAALGFDKSDLFDKKVDDLSGGERQRVAIARAVIRRPRLVFADEPTGNLDSETRETVMTGLRRLVDEQGCTVVVVTHDPVIAARYADDVVKVVDGKVECVERGRRKAIECPVLADPETDTNGVPATGVPATDPTTHTDAAADTDGERAIDVVSGADVAPHNAPGANGVPGTNGAVATDGAPADDASPGSDDELRPYLFGVIPLPRSWVRRDVPQAESEPDPEVAVEPERDPEADPEPDPAPRLSVLKMAWRLLWGVPVLTWLNLFVLSFGLGALVLIGSVLMGVDEVVGRFVDHDPTMKQISMKTTGRSGSNQLFDADARGSIQARIDHGGLTDRARLIPVERLKVRFTANGRSRDLSTRSSVEDDPLLPAEVFQVGRPLAWHGPADGPVEVVLWAEAARRLGLDPVADAEGAPVSLVVARKRDGRAETDQLDARVVGVLADQVNVDSSAQAALPLEVSTRLRLWQEAVIEGFWDEIDSPAEVRPKGYERIRLLMPPSATPEDNAKVVASLGRGQVLGTAASERDNAGLPAFVNLVAGSSGRGEPVRRALVTLFDAECTAYLARIADGALAAETPIVRLGGRGPLLVSPDLLAAALAQPDQLADVQLDGIPAAWKVELGFGGVVPSLPPRTVLVDLSDDAVRAALDRFLATPDFAASVVACRVGDRADAVALDRVFEDEDVGAAVVALDHPELRVAAFLNTEPDPIEAFGRPAFALAGCWAMLRRGTARAMRRLPVGVLVSDARPGELLQALSIEATLPSGEAPIVFVSSGTIRRGCDGIELRGLGLEIPRARVVEAEFPPFLIRPSGDAFPLVVVPRMGGLVASLGVFETTARQVDGFGGENIVIARGPSFASVGTGWLVCAAPPPGTDAHDLLGRVRDRADLEGIDILSARIDAAVRVGSGKLLAPSRMLGPGCEAAAEAAEAALLVSEDGKRWSTTGFLGGRGVAIDSGLDNLYGLSSPIDVAFVPRPWLRAARLIEEGKRPTVDTLSSDILQTSAPVGPTLQAGSRGGATLWSTDAGPGGALLAVQAPEEKPFDPAEATEARMQTTPPCKAFMEVIVRCEAASRGAQRMGTLAAIGEAERDALAPWMLPFDDSAAWAYDGQGPVPVVLARAVAEALGVVDDPAAPVTLLITRPAEVDHANRTLGLPCVVVGIALLAGDDLFVPTRVARFVRGWQQGAAVWESGRERFAAAGTAERQSDGYLYLDVFAREVEDVEPIYQAIRPLSPQYDISTNLAVTRQYERYQRLAMTMFAFVTVLTLLGSLVAITCAFWGEAVRRTRDIAVMRVVGASQRLIWVLYMMPAQFIGIGAAVAGTLFGLLLVGICCSGVDEYLAGIDLSRLISVPWWSFFAVLGIASVFCFAGSYLPARNASRQPVANAMR